MSQPRIAIPLPTSADVQYNLACWPQYADAIRDAGGEPVKFSLDIKPSETAQLVNSCAGILLPGSPADVSSHKYGQETDPATSPSDWRRENVDELLLQDAHNLYKPIFGICYGAQSLNVWRGGSLVQDLNIMPVNHAAGQAVAVAHAIAVDASAKLGQLAADIPEHTENQRILINSSHHQAIGITGDALKIVARCPDDGVVEAIEGGLSADHFVLGVQWHPERSVSFSALSHSLFLHFVQECAQWDPRRIQTSVVA